MVALDAESRRRSMIASDIRTLRSLSDGVDSAGISYELAMSRSQLDWDYPGTSCPPSHGVD
jgi:hypothetical protein